jgi:hypothetical protein
MLGDAELVGEHRHHPLQDDDHPGGAGLGTGRPSAGAMS